MKSTRSVCLAVLGLLASGLLGLSAAAPAQAATCASSDVTVVVQFPDRTEVGCAAGDPSSGFDALKRAGFTTTRVQQQPGALCSINDYPTQRCGPMPPANAYWSYWQENLKTEEGDWGFSERGADNTNPVPGSFEGWRFGGSKAPDVLPPARPSDPEPTASAPTKKPTKKPSPGSSGGTKPRASDGPAATSSPTATPTAGVTASATPTDGTTPAPPTASDPPAGPSSVVTATASGPSSGESDDSSGGLSWVWGVLLLGGLGAAGAAAYVRNNRG